MISTRCFTVFLVIFYIPSIESFRIHQNHLKRYEISSNHAYHHIESLRLYSIMKIDDNPVGNSIALIAGTTVGAGILALPTAASHAGFIPSSLTLFFSWIIMCSTGILIAEASCFLSKQNEIEKLKSDKISNIDLKTTEIDSSINGIVSMTSEVFGVKGAIVSSMVYALNSYVLLTAYIAQAGNILNQLISSIFSINTSAIGPLLFSISMGSIMTYCSNNFVESFNNFLFVTLMVIFVTLLCIGIPDIQVSNLFQQDISQVWQAIPVMLIALVYHNIIPSICQKLQYKRFDIIISIVAGSFLPLLMFIAWNSVILGIGLPTPITNLVESNNIVSQITAELSNEMPSELSLAWSASASSEIPSSLASTLSTSPPLSLSTSISSSTSSSLSSVISASPSQSIEMSLSPSIASISSAIPITKPSGMEYDPLQILQYSQNLRILQHTSTSDNPENSNTFGFLSEIYKLTHSKQYYENVLQYINVSISLFGLTAITTSFIGFVISLIDFYRELFNKFKQSMTSTISDMAYTSRGASNLNPDIQSDNTMESNVNMKFKAENGFELNELIEGELDQSLGSNILSFISSMTSKSINTDVNSRNPFLYCIVIVPPLFIALTNPSIFLQALDYAGTYGVSILFGLLPILIAFSLRR